MSEPGFASLGPSLLARKGGARPAMRPQVAPLVAPRGSGESDVPDAQLEDLGWNDMGHDSDPAASADVVAISSDLPAEALHAGPGPIVRRQQRRLEQRLLADAAMTGPEDAENGYDEDEDTSDIAAFADAASTTERSAESPRYAPRHTATPRVPAAQSGRRAAFTLRLDADRHLKLRLAATMQGVSAQVLVTEALDRLLAEYDDLDVIAKRLKRH